MNDSPKFLKQFGATAKNANSGAGDKSRNGNGPAGALNRFK